MVGCDCILSRLYKLLLSCIFYIYYRMHHEATQAQICKLKSSSRRTAASSTSSARPSGTSTHGRCELDSHADTIVAGSNCIILNYTGKVCDVSPYRDDYDPVSNVPIVKAATAWQSSVTGQVYILVFNESLWMGDSMDMTLINPNQLRHFGTDVQDNPSSPLPLSIITEDREFCMELLMEGTIIYANTHTPTDTELKECPHIILSSPHPWNPHSVRFQPSSMTLEDVMNNARNVSTTRSRSTVDEVHGEDEVLFDLTSTQRRIAGMKLIRDDKIDVGTTDVPNTNTFHSSNRHSDISPEALSERWCISLKAATNTLKKTTQRFLRSAVLPLSRRYRTDMMFERKTLRGQWSTDTMDGRCKSLDGNRYAQVFANKSYFSRIYPMDSKSKAGDALRLFCQEFGVPEKLTFDGSREQTGKGTQFMKQVRRHDIDYHISEPDMHNQNPVEGVIRELRRKWYRIMIRKRVPKELWDYGLRWVSEVSSLTHTSAGSLNGCIPITEVTGETPDISEYLDFGFYDYVWFKDNAGLSPKEPGRWLGVSSRVGRSMCYWILNQNGKVVSRSSVQPIPSLELSLPATQETLRAFDLTACQRMKTEERGYDGDKPNPDDWADLIDEDEDFREEFQKIYNDDSVPEADDYTPEVGDDTYINMEVVLPRDDEGPTFAKVTKRLRDANGIPIGTANDNPILDSRMYEVEYLDGYRASLSANAIAENMFAQVDEDGNRYTILDDIVDHRVDGTEIKKDDAFITSKNGGKRRKMTTRGWEILLQWKDGSTTWEAMKDIQSAYPVQLAEYALKRGIADEPAFAWWLPHVIKKRNRIIAKTKSKYWTRTHKFGIRLPHSVEEALAIDRENGDTLWWDAICKEMKNVRVAFEEYDGDVKDLVGYKKLDMHMIFDIKMGENFRRKARLVADGHKTATPASITYSSVVSRDSVRIALTIAALNDLQILACDILNAYLTAPCREKFYCTAGPEFGSDRGKTMIVVRALYGLKSSGAAFRSFLAEHLYDIGYKPSPADPDVWMRPAVKDNGFKYWEYVLCYVDDLLAISHNPSRIMKSIEAKFRLKNDAAEVPENYLGAAISQMDNEHGDYCWAMSSDKYCIAVVKNIEDILQKKGLRLPSKCVTPLSNGYKPEMDCTPELKADGIQFYQEIIGQLRWAIELGRVDILLETSLMSTQLALPRDGHLEQLLHIVGYLKSHKKMRLLFDCAYPKVNEKWFQDYDWFDFYRDAKEAIPPNMPEARGHDIIVSCFVDANHAGNQKDRRSQTGILIFINKSPIIWYSKRQNTVETSTFGAEFCAMKIATEMIEAMRYKLRMFGVPIDGPANVYCDNEAVYKNTSIPESTLKKKHHSIAYHRCREAVAARTIRVAKQGTEKNLADLFTKILTVARRAFLLERFTY